MYTSVHLQAYLWELRRTAANCPIYLEYSNQLLFPTPGIWNKPLKKCALLECYMTGKTIINKNRLVVILQHVCLEYSTTSIILWYGLGVANLQHQHAMYSNFTANDLRSVGHRTNDNNVHCTRSSYKTLVNCTAHTYTVHKQHKYFICGRSITLGQWRHKLWRV